MTLAAAIWSDVAAAQRTLGGHLGDVEQRAMPVQYDDVDRMLMTAPAVVEVPGGALVIVGANRRSVRVLDREQRVTPHSARDVAVLVRAEAEARIRPDVDRLLASAGVGGARRERSARALLARRLAGTEVTRVHVAEPRASRSLAAAMRAHRLWPIALAMIAASAASSLMWLACWWAAGRIALDGEASLGWVSGWILALATLVPLRVATSLLVGKLVIAAGMRLKQRLVVGSLRSSLADVRTQGIGELMGRILKAETVETAGLGGAIETLVGSFELALALWVLGTSGAGVAAILLGVWFIGLAWAITRWTRQRGAWLDRRRTLTLDTVDHMLGHRTRVAQQRPEQWHVREDDEVAAYVDTSRAMDARIATIQGVVPRGWMIVGLVALVPRFLTAVPDATLAVAVGGVLLAAQALARLTQGTSQLVDAHLAWRQVAALARAAHAVPPPGVSVAPATTELDIHDVSLAHPRTAEPVLRRIDLRAAAGERILVEGASGSGKSSLAMVLAGLRAPRTGAVFLGGLDRQTLGGEAWARRVVLVPQLHDNHVMSASLGFNLLLGRAWPPARTDMAAAREVCAELGLADLLARMPGGFEQQVGETGWQLSHGERARVFLARALLQRPDVLILDETLDSIDPPTREPVLRAILARVPIVIAIEHV